MPRYNFNLKKASSIKETLILMIIRWNGLKLVYSTKESIHPKFWELDNSKRNFQRAKETRQFPEYPEFNARLDFIETTAKNIFRQFVNDNNRQPTVVELTSLLNHKFRERALPQKMTLFLFIDKFIKEAEARHNPRTGKTIAKSTIQVYTRTKNSLKEFAREYYGYDFDFDLIDQEFYDNYKYFLTVVKNHANNTVGNFIKTLKTILNEAVEQEYTKNTAHRKRGFIVIKEDTYAVYLNDDELEALSQLDLLDNPSIDRARDLFLLGCYTGLRFSDFNSIKSENFRGEYLNIKTRKTGNRVVIPLHPFVKTIMAKYSGKTQNSLPPSMSNAGMNKLLKILAKKLTALDVDVTTSITKGGKTQTSIVKKYDLIVTHTARRSFATNLYKAGLPSLTIMNITGHRTEKAFLRYIKVTPTESAKILQAYWEKNEIK
jgi:integrase